MLKVPKAAATGRAAYTDLPNARGLGEALIPAGRKKTKKKRKGGAARVMAKPKSGAALMR